jgi:hypothetical protein
VVAVESNSSNSSQAPLDFLYPPQLFTAGNTSVDVQLALNQAGLVYYVLLPGQALQRHLLQTAAAAAALTAANGGAIMATAAGHAGTGLEVITLQGFQLLQDKPMLCQGLRSKDVVKPHTN